MIAVCPNPYRDTDLALTRRCCSLLQEAGFDFVISPVFAKPGDEILPSDLAAQELNESRQTLPWQSSSAGMAQC